MPGGLGSRPFDGEGAARRAAPCSSSAACSRATCSTPTRRASSGWRPPATRARHGERRRRVARRTSALAAAPHRPSDLIASRARPLVTELIGFGFNAVTGDYSRGAAGLWIEGGELAHPVEEITIAGNLCDMLAAIDGVGNDLVLRDRTVGPTLLIGRMVVAGH